MTINTENDFYEEQGMYIWGFSAKMIKDCYIDDNIDSEPEQKDVLSLSGGIVVPCFVHVYLEMMNLI